MQMRQAAFIAGLILLTVAAALGDIEGVFNASIDDPAIRYTTAPVTDPVYQLNLKIQQGAVHLKFDDSQGYLRSVLDALNVPIESQMVVFSKTSVQMARVNPTNPRSLFFNDSVAVAWIRGDPTVEFAAEDPKQGVIFYTLDEKPTDKPQFTRRTDQCLSCHFSHSTLLVPGMTVRSVFPRPDGTPAPELGDYLTDDRSPFDQRWGGWYVTGLNGSAQHMGNLVFADPSNKKSELTSKSSDLESLKGVFDTDAYLSPYSDIVALMVFEHETHMMNLLTRMGWEARVDLAQEQANPLSGEGDETAQLLPRLLRGTSREVVDYMLFADEAPLAARIQGTSGFAEKFSIEGPIDSKGRSLRQLDLVHRLMRYPCSYMIYSEAFDSLPSEAKDAIYERMWQILSGQEKDKKYAKLSSADRKAIVEILRETKKDLPDYFRL
jgi:hypothetical protein